MYSMLRECAVPGKISNGQKRRLQKDDRRDDGRLVQPSGIADQFGDWKKRSGFVEFKAMSRWKQECLHYVGN